jgi:arylsulfatase A-like enzyme
MISVNQSKVAWSAEQTIKMIQENANGDKPFFIRWDPSEPHLPCVVPEPYASMYEPDQIPEYGSFKDPMTNKPYMQKQQLKNWQIENWTWENEWSRNVALYYGEISLLDYQIGKVVDALEKTGVLDNTIIIYTTDHGDMCGSHRMLDKHFVMYDDIVKVPLIIRWKNKIKAGMINEDFVVHTIDLASTILDLVGIALPPTFQGQSLKPTFKNEQLENRDDIMSTYHGAQFGLYSQRMLRTRKYKYIWNATDIDELYDLQKDPWEIENLISKDCMKDILADMRHRLYRWMQESQDVFVGNPWIIPTLLNGNK